MKWESSSNIAKADTAAEEDAENPDATLNSLSVSDMLELARLCNVEGRAGHRVGVEERQQCGPNGAHSR